MTLNRLEASVEDSLIADVAEYAALSKLNFDVALADLLKAGLFYRAEEQFIISGEETKLLNVFPPLLTPPSSSSSAPEPSPEPEILPNPL